MNRFILASLFAVAAAASISAFADDITVETKPFVSTLSRSEARSELARFKQAGHNPWAQNYNQLSSFRSSMTRAQATAEYLQSRDEVARLTAEDSGSAVLVPATRAIAASVVAGRPVSQ